MPEDALSTKDTQHDYTDLMRLESPHEVKPNPEYEPGRPDVPRGIVEDQRERLNTGEPPVDGVAGVAPGGQGEVASGDTSTSASDAGTDAEGEGGSNDDQRGPQFNPSDHNVAEVKAYLDGLADDDEGHAERDRVLAAEKADKARVGVLEG